MKTNYLSAVLGTCLLASCSQQQPTEIKRIAALDDALWPLSQWISAPDAPIITDRVDEGSRAADGASWFVSTLVNDKEVASARWMTTSLGVNEIYVNGLLIGNEILKPGFTHYLHTRCSYTYDVTAAFLTAASASNTLSAQVTPGWWADKIITPAGQVGMNGKKCAFRSVLELTFTDGTTQVLGTDLEHWKAGIAGPVTHADIYDGEEYDARQLPGYLCVEQLQTPELNEEFQGEIVPANGAEIYTRPDLELQPVKAYVWKDIEGATEQEHGHVVITREYATGQTMTLQPGETLVIDFGQNSSAVPDFTFSAPEGTTLTCLPAELLNDGNGAYSRGMDGPEGSVHRRNLRAADTGIRLTYTFADCSQGEANYSPRHTFFGYRFLSLTATAPVTISRIVSLPVTSITEEMETGKISTGNELVNQLISNTLWGQRSNYLSVTTDCPQRNERLGWTADTQVFTETGTYFANTDQFFHKWMRDMRDTQTETGAFPGVAPWGQYGSDELMRLGWADAGVIVPWTVWKQFADVDIINENWEAMERFIEHINTTHYDHNLLKDENRNFQWADWLSYEPLESCGGGASGPKGPLPEAVTYWNYLSASYWAIDARMMYDMAKATGRDTQKYEQMASEAKQYLIDNFLNEQGEFRLAILNTMQTPALFALKNGLVEGTAKENMIARLKANFVAHDNCLQTGFLGTSILMNTLTENGMTDLAYELLLQRKNPSWLYSVDNGATTIWERWNSYMIEKGMGPAGMNSFNHYAYGCVCEWIWKTVAGIASDVQAPGFRHIIMAPVPDKRLGSVDATYRSAAGLIKSEWHYEGDEWIWNFTIPEGCTASVTLPGETEATEYQAGSYTIKR